MDDEPEVIVRLLYAGILRREPDETGVLFYSNEVKNGRSIASIIGEFVGSEEFRTNIRLFTPPGHFYSPIVDPSDARDYLDSRPGEQQVHEIDGIEINRDDMLRDWGELKPFLEDIPFRAEGVEGLRYAFDNANYGWGDGSILHAMLRLYKPRRLIEVGSGWSSACSIDTIERYFNGDCDVTFIEPYPRLLENLLGETSVKTTIIDKPVQSVPHAIFEQLQAGDFLFIDSTHVLKTGSDVCYELFDVLPRLAPGVFVHFHDIFWPFEYPREWVIQDNRSWNEIYALRAFLSGNRDWRIVFFNHYLWSVAGPELMQDYPAFANNPGGALWIQRRP